MADGGFLVKIGDKETFHCYKISFDYDTCTYQRNNEDPKEFPRGDVGKIEIVLE